MLIRVHAGGVPREAGGARDTSWMTVTDWKIVSFFFYHPPTPPLLPTSRHHPPHLHVAPAVSVIKHLPPVTLELCSSYGLQRDYNSHLRKKINK